MNDQRSEESSVDADVDDTASMPVVEDEPAPAPQKSRSGFPLLSLIALVAALGALACSGVLLWQYRQFYVSLADADDQAQSALERVRAAAASTDESVEEVADTVAAQARQMRDLGSELDAMPAQFADLQRRIDAMQGGSFDARMQWLLAEAAWFLNAANAELQLGARYASALTALRLADDRLREAADPGLAPVREQLAEEILALESVRLVDTEGLAHTLSTLTERVSELPLRGDAPSAPAQTPADDDSTPGLERLWSSVKGAFSGIVRVERRDDEALENLTLEEARLIRRQLRVELQTARLALVSGEGALFDASLQQAAAMLQGDFNVASADVEGALRLLESLREFDIAPTPPDISRSLYLLRAYGEP